MIAICSVVIFLALIIATVQWLDRPTEEKRETQPVRSQEAAGDTAIAQALMAQQIVQSSYSSNDYGSAQYCGSSLDTDTGSCDSPSSSFDSGGSCDSSSGS